jgi:3-methyladenine DNA glycosylase AlkD
LNKEILKEIYSKKNTEKAKIFSWFFKTGKGQYGEGDKFLGITVPVSRKIAIKYKDITLSEISVLLKNKFHEVRLIALLILVHKYKLLNKTKNNSNEIEKKKIINFYLKNTKYINNWDLVDLSCHYTLGNYLIDKNRTILKKLAKSKNIWERRMAMISTFAFIYAGEYKWTFEIAEMLLKDEHDLIQKIIGWMLREVGKRVSIQELEKFLNKNKKMMSRTTLRYAIEKFPEHVRKEYLKK